MKRTLALLCALALLLGLGATALAAVDYGAELDPNGRSYSQTFSDVPTDHWAFQYIEELVERGAINGYPDGNFYPNNTVTRQEFAKIMVVAAGEPVYPASTVSFSDVPLEHWANPFVEAAKPYMTAYQDYQGNQTFRPETGALREDMAVAVVKLRGYDTRLADLSMLTTMFSDVDSISTAAQPYVALAVENGIISGYPGENGGKGTFGGQRTITRSEAAAILWRAFQYGSDQKVIAGDETTAAATPKATTAPKATATPKPTATTTTTATPTPTATPKPEKPFIAETVVKNVKISDTDAMITMDGDSNLIFYNENTDQIVSLDPDTDKTRVLLDVSAATCEIPVEGQTAALSAEEAQEVDEDEADDAPLSEEAEAPDQSEPEPEPAPPATVTYEDLTVKQVFWDDVAGRLLVWGEFASVRSGGDDGWDVPDKDTGLNGIFVLENKELTYFAEMPEFCYDYFYGNYDYASIRYALSDGTYILGEPKLGLRTYDFSKGSIVTKLGDYGCPIFQYGSDIYICQTDCLTKYNYGTGWADVIGYFGEYGKCYTYANQKVYAWNSKHIWAIRPTDIATQDKLDPSEDVEVKDLRPLPTSPNNLRVTGDEQYLFYDSSSNAIRVIRANPEA